MQDKPVANVCCRCRKTPAKRWCATSRRDGQPALIARSFSTSAHHSTAVHTYYRKQIDIANLKIWWYVKNGGRATAFIPGGTINPKLFDIHDLTSATHLIASGDTSDEASVQRILDVGKDPTIKARLLQGSVNVARCPHCGTAGRPLRPRPPDHIAGGVLGWAR